MTTTAPPISLAVLADQVQWTLEAESELVADLLTNDRCDRGERLADGSFLVWHSERDGEYDVPAADVAALFDGYLS